MFRKFDLTKIEEIGSFVPISCSGTTGTDKHLPQFENFQRYRRREKKKKNGLHAVGRSPVLSSRHWEENTALVKMAIAK